MHADYACERDGQSFLPLIDRRVCKTMAVELCVTRLEQPAPGAPELHKKCFDLAKSGGKPAFPTLRHRKFLDRFTLKVGQREDTISTVISSE